MFSKKWVFSESGEKYAQAKHRLQVKTVLNKYKYKEEQGVDLFLIEEAL